MQILHLARDSEVRPHHQARTPQTKADILSRPICTTHLAPRFPPMGGSYPKTTRKGHGSEREFNYTRMHKQRRTRHLKPLSNHKESFSWKDAAG